MAEIISKYVVCPKCKQQSATNLLLSGNTAEDTDLRAKIFDESLFRWKCKKCGFSSRFQHPLLYNDIEGSFMIYYIPSVTRSKVSDPKLEAEFPELSDIRKRVVPDVNALKEKIVVFENGLNDYAVELAKLAVSELVSKDTGHNVYAGYYTDHDLEKNTISFQFFVGGDKRSYIQSTRFEVYKRSLEIVKKISPEDDKMAGFLNIGREWAKNALERYKGL